MGVKYIFIFILFLLFSSDMQSQIHSGTILNESRSAIEKRDYEKALLLADSVYKNTNVPLRKIESRALRAKALVNLGRLNEADEAYNETIALSQQEYEPENPSYLNALFNYSQFLAKTGRYEEALKIINFVPTNAQDELIVDIFGLKAAIYNYQEEYGKSEECLDSAIFMAEKLDLPQEKTATLIQNRAYLKYSYGDYPNAITDYNLAIDKSSGVQRAITESNLALTYAKNGNYNRAISLINNSLANLKKLGETDEEYIIALRKKAEILHLAGKKKEAAKNFEKFLDLERERLIRIVPQLSPQARLDYWTKEKPLLSKAFLAGEYAPQLAMETALLRRLSSLLSGMGDVEEKKLRETTTQVSQRLKENEAAIAFVMYEDDKGDLQNAAITLDSKGKSNFIPLFSQDSVHAVLNGETFSLNQAITEEDPRIKNLLYTNYNLGNSLWQPIISRLPARVNTLHFAPEGVFHLWGIENMPFENNDKFKIIRHFSLTDIGNSQESVNLKDNILVAGGFDYNELAPWSGYDDESAQKESERHIKANHDAYKELIRGTKLLEGTKIFTALPGTYHEVNQIKRINPDVTLLYRMKEEDVKRSPLDYSVIHLATHGYTLNPGVNYLKRVATDSLGMDMSLWYSGIAFSGANNAFRINSYEDGILSAREVCDLDLSNNSLIILSACQTAQGEITDENASGLIRALKNAGASTIVASLWEVDDESTVFFMTEFHKALNEGKSKYDSFIEAREQTRAYSIQKPLRKFHSGALASRPNGEFEEEMPYSEPWYWAPFILIDP